MCFIYKDLVHKVVEAVLPKKQAAIDLYEMKVGQRVIAKWRDVTREEKRRHYGNCVRATAFHRRFENLIYKSVLEKNYRYIYPDTN